MVFFYTHLHFNLNSPIVTVNEIVFNLNKLLLFHYKCKSDDYYEYVCDTKKLKMDVIANWKWDWSVFAFFYNGNIYA